MTSNPTFSQSITQYIWKALHIWPALQISLSQLPQSSQPPQGSPITSHNFTQMSNEQFINYITKDMHDYIFEHDVKVEHIVDYLIDVLAILNSEEQNQQTMYHMAKQLVSLIQDVPEGKYQRLEKMRGFYDMLKGKNIGHQIVGNQDQSGSEQEENDYEDYEDHDDHDHEKQQDLNQMSQQNKSKEQKSKIEEQVPKLVNEEGQKMEDDGWVVVKKKSRR